jgi:hypothetical protein
MPIRDLATDQRKREPFTRLAEHLSILASEVSFFAYDLCISPPVLTLSIPTDTEVIYSVINFGMSFAVPWLSGQAAKSDQCEKEESVTLEVA